MLGFKVDPKETLDYVFKEITSLWQTFSSRPIFGVRARTLCAPRPYMNMFWVRTGGATLPCRQLRDSALMGSALRLRLVSRAVCIAGGVRHPVRARARIARVHAHPFAVSAPALSESCVLSCHAHRLAGSAAV